MSDSISIANIFLDRYRKDPKPDRKTARSWEKERTRKQIHLHQPINGTINGSINTVNGRRVGTVNEQVKLLPRRTQRRIKRVNYAEKNRVTNTGKRTLLDEESEVYDNNDDEIEEMI
ncbi:hypothetical protein GLOIN_2v1785886 [Rhizophagus clarus]|uniref:Uncharacterized protein n=1 Tax=Rhizophagus clarus TaxID=94130 RepID=A0A8H3QUX6_9GLOM|nr:hypothetical protein GLOIN_2v1785886 [Rhizophagus clarus]